MRYVINIGCSVIKGRKEVIKVENEHFKLHFDNMSIACQWTLKKAKELYPELEYGTWNDPWGDQSYLWCGALSKDGDTIFGSMIEIEERKE
jgi:hypothetical protein